MDTIEEKDDSNILRNFRAYQLQDKTINYARIQEKLYKSPKELIDIFVEDYGPFESNESMLEKFKEKHNNKPPKEISESLTKAPEEIKRILDEAEKEIIKQEKDPTWDPKEGLAEKILTKLGIREKKERSERFFADPERGELRKKLVEDYFNPEKVPYKRDTEGNPMAERPPGQKPTITVITGPPAAGKSSAAKPIVIETGALVVDSDIVKTGENEKGYNYDGIPEYGTGMGVSKVHNESSEIAWEVLQQAREKGLDIVYPTLGGNSQNLINLAQQFKQQGYEVNLLYNDLPIEECVENSPLRYLKEYCTTEDKTGRLVRNDLLVACNDNPYRAFYKLVKENPTAEIDGQVVALFDKFEGQSRFGSKKIDLESMLPPVELGLDSSINAVAAFVGTIKSKLGNLYETIKDQASVIKRTVSGKSEEGQEK